MPIVSESTTTSGLTSRYGQIGSESDTGESFPAKLYADG
jgi:hypothetical protein